jgi:GNAT superfamily N-acetyltransferase
MISFQIEDFDQFTKDAAPIMESHAEELKKGLGVEFELDMGLYEWLFYHGELLLLTARDKGAMVGYLVIRVTAHNRSKSTKIAQEEALFLLPEYRRGNNGAKLIKLGLKAAEAMGAQKFYITSQECKPIGNFLSKLGFTKKSETYEMSLEQKDG